MAKLPKPPTPEELARCSPDWRVIEAGALLWRIYFRAGLHPSVWNEMRAFGPTTSRFDHHEPPPSVQRRAILYCASEGSSAIAEVFQPTRVIDRRARSPWLAAFRIAAPLQLLDLTGSWPTRAGASMALCSGPRPRARDWSRVIHAAYPAAAGLFYPSSMYGNRPILALYERARPALPARPEFHRALADPTLHVVLRNAAAELGYAVI